MKIEETFAHLENCLRRNPETVIWWRDDDVSAVGSRLRLISNLTYAVRLDKILALVTKYAIPSYFAVIPHNFSSRGGKQIRLLKKYGVNIALHGITHMNNSSSNISSEFPDDCNLEATAKVIQNYREEFSGIFANKLLPIFVPPWNNISPKLEKKLLDTGFTAISKMNTANTEYSADNVDIDVVDWSTRELREESAILNDIIFLINSGRKRIGIMNHHKVIHGRGFIFFDNLFKVLTKNLNYEILN